ESGIIIKKASDWVKDFSDSPFLTKSGSRKPLISICIPTFNRAHCLPITLDTLIHQPEFEQGLVEIVISDNASSDNTEEVGRYYSDNFSMIRYFKNDMNIRDGNFRLALNRGTGLLRKLNNDTCIHRSDSLSYMCRMAKKYAYIKPAIYFGNSPGNGDNDSLHTMRSFLKKESFHITWIASFATWDEDCGGDEDQYIYGDQLWQVRRLIHLIEKRKVVAACDKMFMNGMIYNKNYSASWLWEVFHDQYFDIVGNYLTEKDKEVIEADLLFNHFEIVKKTSELYPENMKIDKDFDAVMKEHYGDKPYWDAYCKDYQQWHDETFIEGGK
ncbi:MAG: glycosyltransferase, partial [Coriobacteriaceae bacterium]